MKAELDTERREAPNWPPNCTWRSHLGPLACAQWCKSLHNDFAWNCYFRDVSSGRRQQLHHYNGTRTTPLWLSSNKPLNCQALRKYGSKSQLKITTQYSHRFRFSFLECRRLIQYFFPFQKYCLTFLSSKIITNPKYATKKEKIMLRGKPGSLGSWLKTLGS